MNEAEFRGEKLKTLQALKAGNLNPNAVISGMRLKHGSYCILSRIGDDVWILPDSQFSAGTPDNRKKLDFLSVPRAFRETLRACIAYYTLSGIEGRRRPMGATIKNIFELSKFFLNWLEDHRIARLSDVTPLIAQQYVEFCKGRKSTKGVSLSRVSIKSRLLALETLHTLSQYSDDSMPHPWPESSASHLAGLTGSADPRRQEAKTAIIPDNILRQLFQSAVEWLGRADEIIRLSAQVNQWQSDGQDPPLILSRLKKLGWTHQELCSAEQHLQAACMCIVLITSGIRISELCSLENQCAFKTLDEEGEPFHWMRGISYKTGTGTCEWLVTKITHRALTVAERINRPMQAQIEQRIDDLRNSDPHNPEITRLYGHVKRLFLGIQSRQNDRIGTLTTVMTCNRINSFAAQYKLDWRFKPHQFRRTFAVYAAHSALGDLRYLRDHFKHWSLDMTILYAMSRQQDAELYDTVGLAALNVKTDLLEHWLEPDAILTGGAAEPIRSFRSKSKALATKTDRAEMAKSISPLVHLRATGVAWCTADTGGCNGGQGIEKTRCGDCGNAVIDESHMTVWQGIYAQQIELLGITDIGPGGTERVERDIKRCETVLKELGATKEDLANVAN